MVKNKAINEPKEETTGNASKMFIVPTVVQIRVPLIRKSESASRPLSSDNDDRVFSLFIQSEQPPPPFSCSTVVSAPN